MVMVWPALVFPARAFRFLGFRGGARFAVVGGSRVAPPRMAALVTAAGRDAAALRDRLPILLTPIFRKMQAETTSVCDCQAAAKREIFACL